MKLFYFKKTKKCIVTNNKKTTAVNVNGGMLFDKDEKVSFRGWIPIDKELLSGALLIPNRHGNEFKKFKVLHHNIEILEEYLASKGKFIPEYIEPNPYIDQEKMGFYWRELSDFE